MLSLCTPTSEITCFGCCPPIRPHHYDPLDYAGSLRREFTENRNTFLENGPTYRPIVGYSCWALGFLDSRGRTVGCLLHPARNNGRDLRGLVDYGRKCERESCVPARIFSQLPEQGQRFWLPLVKGLNSFYFSSRRANPLFHLLEWGVKLLEIARLQATLVGWNSTELLAYYKFLLNSSLHPRACSYLLVKLLKERTIFDLSEEQLNVWLAQVLSAAFIFAETRKHAASSAPLRYTHQLPMQDDFLDFLRFGVGTNKASLESAQQLEAYVDELIEKSIPDLISAIPSYE